MTVSSSYAPNVSTGNGVTTVFPYNFRVLAAADMEVSVDGVVKTNPTDYTLSGVGSGSGGNVTFTVAPANGAQVIRRRNMALARTTDYQDNGDLLADVLNPDQDAPVLMAQQLQEQIDRSLKWPLGETTSATMPSAAARAGGSLAFDGSGNPIAGPALGDLTTKVAAAAASAASAAGSATAASGSATSAAGSATAAGGSASAAGTSATLAANYAAAAATGAKFYNTIALGNAGVADAATFGVIAGGSDGLTRPTVYRRESAGVSTALYSVLPASEYDPFVVGYAEYDFGPPVSTTAGVVGSVTTGLVNGDPFAQTGYLGTVTIPSHFPSDSYVISLCTKSGSTFTVVASKTVAHTLGVPNVVTDWHPLITAGVHYLGVHPVTAGVGKVNVISNAGGSYWFSSPTVGGAATQTTGFTPQFVATVRVTNTNPLVTRVAAVETTANAVSGSVGSNNTTRTFGAPALTGGTAGDPTFVYVNGNAVAFSGPIGTVTLGAEHPAGNYTISLCTKSGSTFTEISRRTVTADGSNPTVITDWNPQVTAGVHYLGLYGNSGGTPHYLASAGASQWFKTGYPNGGTFSLAANFCPLFQATILQPPAQTVLQRVVALEAVSGGGVAATTAPAVGTIAPGDKVTMLTNGSWNGMIVYGQSLGEGFNSTPPISTSQPYSNRTFGSGTRSGKSGNVAGAVNTSPGTSTTIALVEDAIQPSAAGYNACGETVCSGATTQLNTLAAKQNGIVPSNLVQLASVAAHGAYPIASLNSGSTWYNQLLDHITEGIARAKAAGVDYQLSDVPWIQGEADADAGTSRATYLAALLQLRTDIETSYRTAITAAVGGSITAKANAVHMLIMQVSSWGAGATLPQLNAIQLAQRDACLPGTRMHMVGPGYPYPRNPDKVHLTAVGELRAARQFGRARKQLLIDGKVPDRFKFLSAWASGTSLTIQCDVPTAPIVIDTTSLAACTNSGMLVKDDTGTLTLSSIAVSGNQITMSLNRSLGANPKFRYALDFDGTSVIGLLGSWGNLRDSTTDTFTSGSTYNMYHWAPHAELDIGVLVG